MTPRRKQAGWALACLTVAVCAGTLVAFMIAEPEWRSAVSSDGILHVSGDAPASSGLEITVSAPVIDPVRKSPVYLVEASQIPPTSTWVLVFSYDPTWASGVGESLLVVYRFDEAAGDWAVYPAVVDTRHRTLSVEVTGNPTGRWSVGIRP